MQFCANLSGAGFEDRTLFDSYDWHGLKRGKVEFVLWQYTLAGEGRLTFHGKQHTVSPGTVMLLYFPDDNRYWLEKGHWEHFFLCLTGSELINAWKEVINRLGPVITLSPEHVAVQKAASLCERTLRNQISTSFERSALCYGLAMTLLQFSHNHSEIVTDPALERATTYCRDYFSREIGVDDLARAADLSRFHFSRVFKATFGVSPNEYLTRVRITNAMQMLREPESTIIGVANRCGYRDSAYFCKVFRKTTGVSPGTFRSSGMYSG